MPSPSFAQPTWAIKDTQGHQINLSDLKGRWLIINYWASWCESCVKEIPQLNSFYQRNKKKVLLLGVNYDHPSMQNLIKTIDAMQIRFPIVPADPKSFFDFPEIEVLPTTFVVNPQGKLIKQLVGPQSVCNLERIIYGSG